MCFTACTTLNPDEQCALIQQVHEGTQIGTQTHISSVGHHIYSYNTRAYNPICKKPQTEEEKLTVDKFYPIARDKQKKRNTEVMISYAGMLVGLIVLGLLIIPSTRSGY